MFRFIALSFFRFLASLYEWGKHNHKVTVISALVSGNGAASLPHGMCAQKALAS